jgi:hypothetical protein
MSAIDRLLLFKSLTFTPCDWLLRVAACQQFNIRQAEARQKRPLGESPNCF